MDNLAPLRVGGLGSYEIWEGVFRWCWGMGICDDWELGPTVGSDGLGPSEVLRGERIEEMSGCNDWERFRAPVRVRKVDTG